MKNKEEIKEMVSEEREYSPLWITMFWLWYNAAVAVIVAVVTPIAYVIGVCFGISVLVSGGIDRLREVIKN